MSDPELAAAQRFSSTTKLTSRAASEDIVPRNQRHGGPVWLSDWFGGALADSKGCQGAYVDHSPLSHGG